jgi:hypothetical protein
VRAMQRQNSAMQNEATARYRTPYLRTHASLH